MTQLITFGCQRCWIKDLCKIYDTLDEIHVKYNILGINLVQSAEKWCTFLIQHDKLKELLGEN